MLIDQAGFLITQAGEADQFDTTTLAALAAGSFAATQGMASLISETNFNSVYQQGDNSSLLILNVDADCLLVVVFKAHVSVGAVKYYALATVSQVAEQLRKALTRAPKEPSTSPPSTSRIPATSSAAAAWTSTKPLSRAPPCGQAGEPESSLPMRRQPAASSAMAAAAGPRSREPRIQSLTAAKAVLLYDVQQTASQANCP